MIMDGQGLGVWNFLMMSIVIHHTMPKRCLHSLIHDVNRRYNSIRELHLFYVFFHSSALCEMSTSARGDCVVAAMFPRGSSSSIAIRQVLLKCQMESLHRNVHVLQMGCQKRIFPRLYPTQPKSSVLGQSETVGICHAAPYYTYITCPSDILRVEVSRL